MFRSARIRLLLWFGIALLAVTLPIEALTMVMLTRTLDRQIDADMQSWVEAVSDALPAPTNLDASDPAQNLVAGVSGASVMIFDREGRLVAAPGAEVLVDLPATRAAAAQALNGARTWSTVRAAGSRYRLLTAPALRDGTLFGVVTAVRSLAFRDERVSQVGRLLLGATVLGGVFAVVAGYFVAGRALAPLRTVYQQQERFIADASHELRSPLAVIRTSADLMRNEATPGRQDELARTVIEVVDEAAELVDDLLTLARAEGERDSLRPLAANLAEAARHEVRRLRALLEEGGFHLKSQLEPAAAALTEAEAARIARALLDNVVMHVPGGGSVLLESGVRNDHAFLAIEDDGPGVSDHDLESIFERFFRVDQARTPAPRQGSGLGLAIVRTLAERRGGSVRASRASLGGLRVEVSLPLSRFSL